MTELNASIKNIPIPPRLQHRPISKTGYPVPWFVAKVAGEYDFRVIAPGAIAMAHNLKRCWLCGAPLGRFQVFTIGPMCSVNRTSPEPPSHIDCAEYAVRACPFLSKPNMRRNEKGLPTETVVPPGEMILRNPGVTALWVTKSYKLLRTNNGVLFKIGPPEAVHWYAEGRDATRAEVMASISSGLPILEELAREDGPEAMAELQQAFIASQTYLPKAA
jgi:hypothetical protein